MRRAYLDYNATAPIRPEAIDAAARAMHVVGNASSVHGFGRDARKIVEDARADVAAMAGVRPAQVIFNSGATEGNNTILSGYTDKTILVSATEHPSLIDAAPKADRLPVTADGVIDLDKLEVILESAHIDLLCLQLVNSETGVIQPVADAARLARAKGVRVHCDAVQAAGRIPLDFAALGVDTMALSAHKFGGPQGVGAIVFREGLQLPKLLLGGGQEKRQRAGTENVASLAGFGIAARLAAAELESYTRKTAALRQKLESGLKAVVPDAIIAGANAPRVSNTTGIIVPRALAETLLMALDLEGIAVSSGSACSSGSFKPSHVLIAMGFDDAASKSALRFSTGWATTEPEIDAALAAFRTVIKRVGKQ